MFLKPKLFQEDIIRKISKIKIISEISMIGKIRKISARIFMFKFFFHIELQIFSID